jgi:hypothetical protein
MTPLRQRMLEDMQLKGFSARTQEAYVAAVRQLAQHFHRSPDHIGEEDLRQYFLYLTQEKKVARATATCPPRISSSASFCTFYLGASPRSATTESTVPLGNLTSIASRRCSARQRTRGHSQRPRPLNSTPPIPRPISDAVSVASGICGSSRPSHGYDREHLRDDSYTLVAALTLGCEPTSSLALPQRSVFTTSSYINTASDDLRYEPLSSLLGPTRPSHLRQPRLRRPRHSFAPRLNPQSDR